MPNILLPTKETFDLAAKLIKQGKIIIIPSNSIYVFACDTYNQKALEKVRLMRESPLDKPLTVVIDKKIISEYADLTPRQTKIIDILLPNPVCVYVSKKNKALDLATTYSDFLCVLWQDSEVKTLYETCNQILAVTSANKKGAPDADTIEKAISYFGDQVDLYIDGGPSRGTKPSAHLDIRKKPVELKRPAPHFPLEKIKSILAEHGLK